MAEGEQGTVVQIEFQYAVEDILLPGIAIQVGVLVFVGIDDTAANVYNTIVNGGRVNVGSPSSSLILCKPSSPASGCTHDGGTLLSSGDSTYQTILRWIQDGAPNN